MRKWLTYIRNHHQDILRILILFAAILLITFRYTQYGSYQYDYEQGRPWAYKDITAAASFPILKSEEELQSEREAAEASVRSYYVWRDAVVDMVRVNFEKSYDAELQKAAMPRSDQYLRDSIRSRQLGLRIIDRIYEKGIINPAPEHAQQLSRLKINLVHGNEVKEVPASDLYTAPQAMAFVDSQLSRAPEGFRPILRSTVKRSLQANIEYDSSTTGQVLRQQLRQISRFRGAVQKDEIIIRHGEIVTPEKYRKLESLRIYTESQYGERNRLLISLGYFIITALLLTIFGFFVFNFESDVFRSTRKLLFILVLIVGFELLVSWAARAEIPSYYVIPFCIVPIILRTFFGTRLSLYAHLVTVLLAGFFLPVGIEYIALNLVAGMVAIFTNMKVHYWSQFFVSIAMIFITYVIGFLGISLVQEGSLAQLQWLDIGWLTINVFLTLLAYPLIPIFEKLFGYVSDITLMELGDLNKPLIKDLQIKAPGTFQHSLQVANLAEAAASEIGANALLVKVGALYHDIGKMKNPVYFIENQSTRYNPHDNLPFEESARIIISHVPEGVEMAKKHNLPDIIIDFIRTHHGSSRVEYFYRSYIKNFPEADVDENKFRYPGPLPFSKETAIVMMADTIEAASRSLKEPTEALLNELVDKLIWSKVEQGQLINADISFREVETVKEIFKKMLKSIYHVRIEYPDK